MEKLSKKDLKEQYKNREIIGGIYRINCSGSGETWLRSTIDMQGSLNRFTFSVSVGSAPEMCMKQAWEKYGKSTFSFEALEEMKKKDEQTPQEFKEDMKTLFELWKERQEAKTS